MNHTVIMAGGVGSRFWPLSTPEHPKQFIDILGIGKTLLQLTVERFDGVCPVENFWVVTNAAYVDEVRREVPGIPASHILAEPAARNTAPCVAWACASIAAADPSANIVVTPSDAFVMDTAEFRKVISEALSFTASRDAIVTIGIEPNRPETGYGYVHCGSGASSIVPVLEFKEKPSLEVAKQYLAEGGYLWNAGIFVFNVTTIIAALRAQKPAIMALVDQIVAGAPAADLFPQCEKISIDYAVMEPMSALGKVYTRPASFGWSDLGNWASLWEKRPHDSAGNSLQGPSCDNHIVECTNSVICTEGLSKAIIQGLDNYIVAFSEGRLLICKRSEEQRIKEF